VSSTTLDDQPVEWPSVVVRAIGQVGQVGQIGLGLLRNITFFWLTADIWSTVCFSYEPRCSPSVLSTLSRPNISLPQSPKTRIDSGKALVFFLGDRSV
jgi:hypothetical protein